MEENQHFLVLQNKYQGRPRWDIGPAGHLQPDEIQGALASHQETDSQLIPHTEASVPTAPASLHVGQRVVSSLITFTDTLQNKGACEYWGSEGCLSWE